MLIVLEGIDGTGKTTIAIHVARYLRDLGRFVVTTREPNNSSAGLKLRQLLAEPERTSTPQEELELFHEDRREHVAKVVQPALEQGHWVVQDRTFYSTAAYQGALGLDVGEIVAASREIAPEPDLVLLLTLEPSKALERIQRNREALDNFEKLDYLQRVDAIYRQLARQNSNFHTVDAGQPVDEVIEECLHVCKSAGVV